MHPFLWTVAGFLAGSLPFSVWIGRLSLGVDIRAYGDHNPGATNVLRAGGKGAAALALLLDMAKGALPISAARYTKISAAWLVPIALAPVFGHAFSPFLGGRGGKAVAVSGGIWTGLTAWEGPTVGGAGLLLGTKLLGANGRAVIFSMLMLLVYFWRVPPMHHNALARPPMRVLLPIWLGNCALLAWTHRADLIHPPLRHMDHGS